MKTLREYWDQLDEISRRDFLKGAGATAGLAATSGAKASTRNLTQEDIKIMQEFFSLYFMVKKYYPRGLEGFPQNQRMTTAINRFKYGYGNGSQFLNEIYAPVSQYWDKQSEKNQSQWANHYFSQANQIISRFESLTEF